MISCFWKDDTELRSAEVAQAAAASGAVVDSGLHPVRTWVRRRGCQRRKCCHFSTEGDIEEDREFFDQPRAGPPGTRTSATLERHFLCDDHCSCLHLPDVVTFSEVILDPRTSSDTPCVSLWALTGKLHSSESEEQTTLCARLY